LWILASLRQRDDGVEQELAVVEAAGADHFALAVHDLGADPADVGALAGVQLGGRAGDDRLAILVLLARRQGLQKGVEGARRPVGHGEAERARGVAVAEAGRGGFHWSEIPVVALWVSSL
jgi:hypothetical protein